MRDIRPMPRPRIEPYRTRPPEPVVYDQAPVLHREQEPKTPVWPARPTRAEPKQRTRRSFARWSLATAALLLLVGVGIGGWRWKIALMAHGTAGYGALEQSAVALKAHDLSAARDRLTDAERQFAAGSRLLLGTEVLLPWLSVLPGAGTLSSGIALMEAGVHLTHGGQALLAVASQSLEILRDEPGQRSLLALLDEHRSTLEQGNREIQSALELISRVRPEDLPTERQAAFRKAGEALPLFAHTLKLSVDHLDLLKELLGGNGPRAYLFLFQNNHELRPTGGFIGSYAFLDISQGVIRRFFVDGIFNPDGQLKANIVPPEPIQKISAGWSLHDSNWFPDFPASAEKARYFYEKTGGPTTDGVIALSPEVLKRVLDVMGPVALPEYGITVDAENFLPLIQEEVELNYDKEENNPKKILGDLTGVILERLVSRPDAETLLALADQVVELLNERHILIFASEPAIQQLIETSGWSGSMLATPYDYLSVVHANINGYKTDGVIRNSIEHHASIQPDGSIIDTVTITRTHDGGRTDYEWWNKVNANYMRVYVPLGSELLSASGMTRETVSPPLDYAALGFLRDEDVVREEARIKIDEASGTRIGEEFGKTVFGNWVYVSPGESVTVTYRYRLPWRVTRDGDDRAVPFSILYQKQSGTLGWSLASTVEYPPEWRVIWQSPGNLVPYERALTLETDLDQNVFVGAVLQTQP